MNLRITSFLNSFYPLSIVLLAFSIPINYRISLYALGLFTLIGFTLVLTRQDINHILKSKLSLGLILFWILHALSLLYSGNIEYGLSDVFKKLSLLIIPLVFIPDLIEKKHYSHVKKVFILSLVISSLYFVFRAIVLSTVFTPVGIFFKPNPVGVPWENYFFYELFVKPHHPTYYSMYLSLGIIFILDNIKSKSSIKAKMPLYFLILYFIGIIFLTSSKAGILTTLILLFIAAFWLLKSKGKLIVFTALSVLVIFGLFLASSNNRFASTIKNIQRFTSQSEIKDELLLMELSRFEVWKAVPGVFKETDWIYGVGVGDVKERLMHAYKSGNAILAFNEELNTHNQFLQTYVGLGLIGLVFLLGILGYNTYVAIAKKNIVLVSFLVIILVNFMFEAVLERVFGVIFFVFYLVIFTNKSCTE